MMGDWVIDFLWSRWDGERISEESYRNEIAIPLFCWRRLADCFRHSNTSQRLLDVFGSTLADLSGSVFHQLRAVDPWFNFPDGSVASVQGFDTGPFGRLIIVTFTQEALEYPDMALRGIFFHEYGHIITGHHDGYGHKLRRKEREIEADKLAATWGFGQEIQAKCEYILFKTKGGI